MAEALDFALDRSVPHSRLWSRVPLLCGRMAASALRRAMAISVFLSTVSGEFRSYLDLLVHDLTRHNVAVKVQEDFKDLGGDTLDKLDVYIAGDAVVHLVGDMCGAASDEAQQRALLAKYPDPPQKLPQLADALGTG